jgi:hypothetical protein
MSAANKGEIEMAAETPKKPATRKKTSASASAIKEIAPKRTSGAKAPVVGVSHDEIARLAHRFWSERGRQHGHDAEDWLRAEQELRGRAS